MARAGQNLRARNARPGDTVDLAPGSSLNWLSDAVGQMSYEDLDQKWGLIDKNPTGETKNVICLADLSNTAIVHGRKFDPDQEREVDASAIPEEQIDCTWIPIPDNVVVTMNTPSATKQLGADRDAGFVGLLRRGARKIFGGGRQPEATGQEEFAPEQITGLPVKYEEPLVYPGERTTYHEQRGEDDEAIPLRSMSLAVPDNEELRNTRELFNQLKRSQWTPVGVSIMEFHALIDKVLDELESGIKDSASIKRMKEFMDQQTYESSSSDPIEAGPGWVPPQLPVVTERGFDHWSSDEEDEDPSSLEDPEQELIEEGEPGPKRKRGVKFTFGPGPTYYLTKEGMEELLVGPYSRGEFNKATYDKGVRLGSKPIKRRDALNSGIAPDVFEAQIEEGYWSTNPEDFFISEQNTMLAIREPDDPDKESFWDTTKRRAGAGVKLSGEVALGSAEGFAAGVGGGVGLASKLRSPLARLGGAALTGMHAATGKALEGTLAGKMLNIETKRLTMLSRVPVGETIMFTVGDDRVGVRRGDRGEVRMGSRGKNKVVYFPDTGEIVQPDQWTMVAITGKAPTPQTGTIGMGLGQFSQTGHFGQPSYRNGRSGGWIPDQEQSLAYTGEFPREFVELMLAIPVSHRDDASERQRQIISNLYKIRIGSKGSKERIDLYRRLRGQRGQVIIRRPEDEPEERRQQKRKGGKAIMTIKKRPEGHEDAGRYYLLVVIPSGRIPSADQAPNGWALYKSRSKILYTNEQEEKDEKVLLLGAMQPGSTAKRDVEMIHSGMLTPDLLEEHEAREVAREEAVDSDEEVDVDASTEDERNALRMQIFARVKREGKEAGLSEEEIEAKLKEEMEERTGAGIIEMQFG